MRTHALLGVLLVPAALALPSSADGQSFTVLSANLSFGLFDGVRIGLTHRSRYQGYDDYCWEEAWDRRWGRSRLGWDGYGSPSHDHLNFYHDCVSGGLAYAYQRWHRRSIRAFRPYRALSRVVVSVMVRDPFWWPRGRYLAYDRWGWAPYPVVVWSGYRGRSVYGAYRAGRTVVTGRRSPLAEPRFKEDPRRSRFAAPRTGRAQRSAAPAGRRGAAARPGEGRRPTEALGRRGGPEGRRGGGEAGTIAAQATRRSERPPGGSAQGRPQAPPTRPSGAVRGSRKGGAAATPERGRVGRTAPGRAAPQREPAAQRPTPNGRAQEARRATPRAQPRGELPSARPGGRGERSVRAPAVRRPAER